jgi:NAD(P)H-quinone oxidoreductase subunit 5
MPEATTLMAALALVVVLAPAALLLALGLPSLVGRPLDEVRTGRAARWSVAVALLAAVGVFAGMLATGNRHVPLDLGKWVEVGAPPAGAGHARGAPGHYDFTVKFVFDRLSVPFLIVGLVLCGTVAHFATKYLHRERGFNRFFVLYAVFVLGVVVATLAGSIETLFTGWELLGLSSALLVAYFHERPAPVRNGLWVWAVYRTTDVGLVLAAIAMHELTGGGDLDQVLGAEPPWPHSRTELTEWQAFLVGLLLLGAAAGKSALVPLSGWLPRAMEGPTPSSAVFYGALSVHFGAFLLLRANPLLGKSAALAAAVVLAGLVTALFAHVVGSVQTDIKSALSFASLAQVGVIVAEVGLGRWEPLLWYVALVHLLGHACLRTLQFLRAPSLLQDYRRLENATGARLEHGAALWVRLTPARFRARVYRFALERGHLDAMLVRFVVRPFVRLFRRCDALERRAAARLNGLAPPAANPSAEAEPGPAPAEPRA